MILRRRRWPEDLDQPHEVFVVQSERLAAARRALLSCLPVGRVAPIPVTVGLDLLNDELDVLRRELPAWRHETVDGVWWGCLAAIDEARAAIPAARAVARRSGELEELLGAVSGVDEPLGEAWQAAERAWNRLRT